MSLVRSLLPWHSVAGAAFFRRTNPFTAALCRTHAVESPPLSVERTILGGAAKKSCKRILLFGCALVSCLLGLASPVSAKSAMQSYVEAMQPGWNRGNTLDAFPTETYGGPLTTQALIRQIAAQGFQKYPYVGDISLPSFFT